MVSDKMYSINREDTTKPVREWDVVSFDETYIRVISSDKKDNIFVPRFHCRAYGMEFFSDKDMPRT